MHDPIAIANHFIEKSEKKGLTLMQLLKLSYFAHGFHLGLSGKPLANELVQAWKFGPVFPRIYNEFKYEPPGPIKELAQKLGEDQKGNECLLPVVGDFEDSEKELMDLIYNIYGSFEGLRLSALTHKEGTPWHKAWNKKDGGKYFHGVTIPNGEIEEYFKSHIIEKYR